MTGEESAPKIPDPVRAAAEARAHARQARDWATADRLRGEIEAAGWRVIDAGTTHRLEPAHPPDEISGGVTRYGSSASVPSRLGEPPSAGASVVLVAGDAERETIEATEAAARHLPPDAQLITVLDGGDTAAHDAIGSVVASLGERGEAVWTSAPLGHAAALNAGIRRTRGATVVVLDPSITVAGDVVTPLVAALRGPDVAVAGAFGLVSADLQHFEEAGAGDVAAVQGYLMAFRRSDAIARGPLDERFRFYRNLDIWWSLVLRDESAGRPPRRAVVVPGLALRRREPHAWLATPPHERARLSKRNFYRVLDRFRGRLDLAVPG